MVEHLYKSYNQEAVKEIILPLIQNDSDHVFINYLNWIMRNEYKSQCQTCQ